ncbi:hypothetical protein [Thermoflavimicrobium dichotomicum]|uniref:Uncharacterized protein n=1 Tax=Thermoflavimicrobium dichotomicum TaxID=46223 RepID=A0A1I3SV97_9BACL|nr:hypothetical protein [Thermoflavimicrobium dichotomicum]SFJ62293.1 hypothetical protein SAMN05421852_11457 [Thermoflavimicrobium dichotomicum]
MEGDDEEDSGDQEVSSMISLAGTMMILTGVLENPVHLFFFVHFYGLV